MKYVSTRGEAKSIEFLDILISGLAPDGGLYVPEKIPQFSQTELQKIADSNYIDIAFMILNKFVGNSIAQEKLYSIIENTYHISNFNHKAVAPLKQLSNNSWILELFHGPTLAFKDFALQLLGNLMDYYLQKIKRKLVIVVATSGDTGSAAIHGLMQSDNIKLFVLHPEGRISDIQRKQMTTVIKDNVFNIAIKGSFDDAQKIVKSILCAETLTGTDYKLTAVNSINWVRIIAQIVYYFYAAKSVNAIDKNISFTVPTGNFGNIFAGYMTKSMGLNIKKLVVATNSNDIVSRFINNNDYSQKNLKQTIAPSMDIQVSSNFERMLYFLYEGNSKIIKKIMHDFETGSRLSVDDKIYQKVRKLYDAYSVTDDKIKQIISEVYQQTKEIICPHTAAGYYAMQQYIASSTDKKIADDKTVNDKVVKDNNTTHVLLATAHPAKFPDVTYNMLNLDNSISIVNNLDDKKEKCHHINLENLTDEKQTQMIKQYILDSLS